MVRSSLVFIALLMGLPALAQEPVGCDKFKWPIDQERSLLAKPSSVVSGGDAAMGAGLILWGSASITLAMSLFAVRRPSRISERVRPETA